ncbi:MAG: FAD-binding protein [Verrucomicrobia bacterium]|nr:FAD-binding protein [Verrucomicrobiota bacterium]
MVSSGVSAISNPPDAPVIDIILPLAVSESDDAIRAAVAARLGVPEGRVKGVRVRKHSLDARKREIKVQLRLEVGIDAPLPPEEPPRRTYPRVPDGAARVVIVGAGPGGLFAALRCLQTGRKPIVLERGKDASSRRYDLAPILRRGVVDEESNYCFGEGGAGTFSDGKLYTRATKRGPVREVYETLVAHGAPERILVDAHPHIGSNLLPNVVKALRESIRAAGGEVHFGAKVTDLMLSGGRIHGVILAGGGEVPGESVILATGHSARDVYRLLVRRGVRLEQKPFAMGVRIEHPQALIDRLQYHYPPGTERPRLLPAARYGLATKIRGRGVHSFCMCPGGFIVPAATANDQVVVNGMSLSRRDSPFANSGLVVSVEPEDTEPYREEYGVLAGIAMQEALEHTAKRTGGGGQVAPGQRVIDFLQRRDSRELPGTSYFPGVRATRLDELLPGWMANRMREGLTLFGRQMRGYLDEEALLIGFETRTSSPVRIPRDPETLEHPELAGLYPCAEGAGYAGGIVSAALDGLRCAAAACAERVG